MNNRLLPLNTLTKQGKKLKMSKEKGQNTTFALARTHRFRWGESELCAGRRTQKAL